jgi:uncharacterized RDD family membrane protein YckC
MAEALLIGLFAYQAWLGTHDGSSIGKRLFGLRVVRQDDSPVSFRTGVLQRSWVLGALPLLVAAAQARPLSARRIFEVLPSYTTAGVIAVAVVLGAAPWLFGSTGRGAHDYIAGTKVVAVVGAEPLTPAMRSRLALIGAVVVAYFLVYVAVLTFEIGF